MSEEKINLLLSKFDSHSSDLFFRNLLSENIDLIDIIKESLNKIREIFPLDTKVSLEYVSNEEEDGNPQLVISMKSKEEPRLLKYLDKFTYDFWLSKLDEATGRIVFEV